MATSDFGRPKSVASVASDGCRWTVHMGNKDESKVAVEVHMSEEMAEQIASRETARIKALNPERDDIPPESVGSAVMNVLGLYATVGRV